MVIVYGCCELSYHNRTMSWEFSAGGGLSGFLCMCFLPELRVVKKKKKIMFMYVYI